MSITVKSKNEYLHTDIGVFSRYDEHYNPDFYPDPRDNLVNQRIRTNHRMFSPTPWTQYKKQLPLSQRGAYYRPKNRQSMKSKYPRPLGVRRSAVTPAQRTRAAANLAAAKIRLAATNQRSQPKAKKLNALLKGHTKDAIDVNRQQVMSDAGASYKACLTSSTNWLSAATGTGLLHSNTDTVFINSVRIKGFVETVQSGAYQPDCQRLRQLVVWFSKPRTGPVSGGNCPGITDVLTSNTIDAMPKTSTANAGSFTILSDRTMFLGRQHLKTTADHGDQHDNTGPQLVSIDQTVQVKRNLQYRVAATSVINGGHYDNVPGAEPGRIEKGLLMLYIINGRGQLCEYDVTTRLNYTA
jgi:hypothetical protein